MTGKDDWPGDADKLRRRAEEVAREKAARTPEDREALSPEATRQALHELQVHQIELEMQNEELRRAQAELDAARARYFDLYDLAPAGYCTLSEQGLIREANLAAAGLLGVARGALVGQPITRFIFKEDQDIYYLHRKQLFETGEPQGCELRMVKMDGTAFWAHLAASAAEDADNAPVCRMVMSDSPERERAEKALRESEERYRQVSSAISDVAYACRLAEAGRYVTDWLTGATQRITGYSADEIKAKHCWGWLVIEEDRALFDAHVIGLAPGSSSSCELRVRHKDGSVRWLASSAECVLSPGAPPTPRIYGGLVDITGRKRAEEALRQSEQRYHSLFEHMLNGFAYCKMLYGDQGRPVDFVYLEVNAAFEQLTGLRDVVGKRVSEVIPGIRESNPELFEIYGRVALTGKPESFELDFKPLSRWLNISAYGPEKGYFVAVFDDITERKLNEVDRETMLALLRLANASNNTQELVRMVTAELQEWSGCEAVGIRLRDGDDFPYYETRGFPAEFVQAGNYLCARDANQELLRDSQGSPVLECMCGNVLRGRFDPRLPFFTAGGSFWTNSTSDLLASTTEADRQSLARNRCHGEGFESVALIPLCCSGRTIGLIQLNDRRANRFTPEKIDLIERAAASLAIALEQRLTQAALHESEERHRLLLEYAGIGVGYWDNDGRALFFNRRALEDLGGGALEHYAGRSVSDLFGNDVASRSLERFREVAASDAAKEYEDCISLPGGARWFLSVYRRVLDSTGQVGGVQVISYDITERKRAEQEKQELTAQLVQSQKMESIGRLAGGVAHDFNNLLTVINGYSQLLLDKLSAGDPLRAGLAEINKAGERAAGLTRQLLAFSRKQVLEPRSLDLNRVVEEMRPMLERLVGESVEVRVALNAPSGTVRADPHQLEQVIMNLAVNARDAMPGGGKLLIETAVVERNQSDAQSHPEARAGRYVVLAVSDSGVGMDEATRQRIFEPFFTTKGVSQGTGLGLSMIQGIVAQSGGYIEVDSEPGQGTSFKIYLPALAEAAADDGRPAAVPALRGKETVLVVEDQAEVRDYAVAVLKAYGYHVIKAGSAGEALLLCEREQGIIHLVLTDVVMPNLSGRELAGRLEKLRPGIKVLFMSGYTDNVIVHQGILEQGAQFIPKPFSPEQLAGKVRAVLGPPAPAPRILVADDEAGVRAFLRAALEEGGYQVTEAADGRQALKEARAGHVDLVITDLVMPKQEGIETIQTLRKEMPAIGIIAITGKFEGPYLKIIELLGADAVLTKPVSAELLLAKVAEVLKLRR